MKRLALAAAGALAALALLEAGLALAGGRPAASEFPEHWSLPDVEARHRLRPGRWSVGRTTYTIDGDGLRGPRPAEPVLLALGDSCTFGVAVRDAETFAALLGGANAGVPGYTVYQGLRRYEALGSVRAPVVSVYFGWNDHEAAVVPDHGFRLLRRAARHSRLAQALLPLQEILARQEGPWRRWARTHRVPEARFEAELRTLAALARSRGARPVIITAPSRSANPLHERWVRAARSAARASGADLLDLSAEIERLPEAERSRLFLDDGLHLSRAGHRLAAERLRPFLAAASR